MPGRTLGDRLLELEKIIPVLVEQQETADEKDKDLRGGTSEVPSRNSSPCTSIASLPSHFSSAKSKTSRPRRQSRRRRKRSTPGGYGPSARTSRGLS